MNHWMQLYIKERDEHREVLSIDPFENWEQNRNPEFGMAAELYEGLDVLYSREADDVAMAFVERAIKIYERAIEEHKFTNSLCLRFFPGNYARAEILYNYAQFLTKGKIDKVTLEKAGDLYFEHWVSNEDRWDHQLQAYALCCARIYLMARKPEKAQKIVQSSNFRSHKDEVTDLKKLLNGHYSNTFFSKVKKTDYQPSVFLDVSLCRFEWACIQVLATSKILSRDSVVHAVTG